jgi:hypothetical protein
MYKNFHQYLLAGVNRANADNQVIAQNLADLLQQSKSNIYKKLRGEVPFTGEEILLIAAHYQISLDQFLQQNVSTTNKLQFEYSTSVDHAHTPISFLQKIRLDLERVSSIPGIQLCYATNEIPIFHYMSCRNLLAFKLFIWARTNWGLADVLGNSFNTDEFYAQWPGLEEHRLAILDLYKKIPTKEYWPKFVTSHIYNQIRYYVDGRFFIHPEMPELLKSELKDMLDELSNLAALGVKDYGPNAASFSLYLNEIAFANNLIIIYQHQQPIAVYITLDNPNYLSSNNPAFCLKMHQWLQRIEEYSFLAKNEQHRIKLFRELKTRIEEA